MKTEYLKDITTKIGSGATPTGGEKSYKSFGISLIRSQNVLDFEFNPSGLAYIDDEQAKGLANVTVEENDILLNITGDSIARCCMVPSWVLPARVNQHVAIIRSKPKISSEYLFYYLQFLKPYLLKICGVGGTRNALTKEVLEELKFLILDQQNEIAYLLSLLDQKIHLNREINHELESLAKTIYNYWFVQFDFPNEEGKPYKSSGGAMEWSEKLKRDIPAGWEVHKIGSLLETSLGGTPSTTVKAYWTNGSFNWLNSGEVAAFPVVGSELRITQEAIRDSATELLPKGTVLLSITRHLRPTILAIDACANQSVVGIREKGDIKSCFLYPYLVNEIPRLMKLRTGAQQPHINKETVDDSLILLPNESSQLLKQYNENVSPIFEQILSSAFQSKEIACLRDFLLPLLMNGQVTVGADFAGANGHSGISSKSERNASSKKIASAELSN